MGGLRFIPLLGHYGATKFFDRVFGCGVDQMNQDSKTGAAVDTQIIYPGMVSTAMTNYHSDSYKTCAAQETAAGALRDLGVLTHTHGSFVHTLWGFQAMCTPDWVRHG